MIILMTKTNSNSPKKILIAVGFQPYPTLFGGAVDVWERIIGLTSMGHIVDLVYTEKKYPRTVDFDFIKKNVRELYYLPRINHWKQLISKEPLQVQSRSRFRDFKFSESYDVVIAEGEYCAQIIENPSLKFEKFVLRIHNDEAYYFAQLKKSAPSLKEKIYYSLEIPKIKIYSQKYKAKADRLWYISAEEWEKSIEPKKSVFLPVPVNEPNFPFFNKKDPNVLFVGSLFMSNNIYALDWYLKFIHPELLSIKNYHFTIVGAVKTEKEQIDMIEKYKSYDNISIFFNQKDLTPFYRKAKIFVNPMFHGSGVKIKSVMALVNGLPLVSTSVGAEGIGLGEDMYWKANDKNSFLEAIREVFTSDANVLEKHVNLAQNHLEKYHYLKVLQQELSQL